MEQEDASSISDSGSLQLSETQQERIQRNRERARALRQARLGAKPYDKPTAAAGDGSTTGRTVTSRHVPKSGSARPSTGKFTDTHGGYLLDDEEPSERHSYRIVEEDAPALPGEQAACEECGKRFAESFLQSKFRLCVCDQCRKVHSRMQYHLRDSSIDGKHSMITKTEAKQRFLLKDCDFEERGGPPLLFQLKRNPHSSRWGDMKLYLLCQVRERAYEIWGGEEGLEVEHQKRSELKEKKKEKKYAKEIKELRRAVRSSLVQSNPKQHEHNFLETYNEETDLWTKTCTECGYQVTFEKM